MNICLNLAAFPDMMFGWWGITWKIDRFVTSQCPFFHPPVDNWLTDVEVATQEFGITKNIIHLRDKYKFKTLHVISMIMIYVKNFQSLYTL